MTAPEPDLTAIRAGVEWLSNTLPWRIADSVPDPSIRSRAGWEIASASYPDGHHTLAAIVEMVNALPELLAVVDRLTAERDEARDEASSLDVTIVEMNKALTRVEAERDALREELAKARQHLNDAMLWVPFEVQDKLRDQWAGRTEPAKASPDSAKPQVDDRRTAVVVPAASEPFDLPGLPSASTVDPRAAESLTPQFRISETAGQGDAHIYLSTYCYHGTHDECGAAQHDRGDLSAPHCKGCPAPCICPRHLDPDAPCWGGDQPRRHDPSCALDAGHLGWCGPAMAASEPEAVNLGRRLHTLECGCSARARSHRDLCPSRPFRMIRPEERTASPEPEADREVTP